MLEVKDPETIIIKVLRIGVIISATLILLGLFLLYIKGGGENTYNNISFNNLLNGIISLNPYSIMLLGLLVLIFTPVVRVIASIFVFYIEKDLLYVRITVIVLVILIISFLIGIYFSN